MKKLFSVLVIALSALFFAVSAFAADIDDARSVAVSILKKMEDRKNAEVWDQHVSPWFKSNTTRDAFLANLTFMQAQLGGVSSSRTLIQQNYADGDPKVNYRGDIFSFVFSATYPASKIYENIVLIRDGSNYKLSGLYFVPNPN